MKVIAIAHRDKTRTPADFHPHLKAQAIAVLKCLAQDKVREIYSLQGGDGACVVLEVANESEASRLLGDLPMAKAGLVQFDIYGLKPYRGIVDLIE